MATHSSILPGKSHDRGAWRATVHGVARESDTTVKQLNTHTHTHTHTVYSREDSESVLPE